MTHVYPLGTKPAQPLPVARVLSIAGTDPTGGAGLHADLKAISAAGGYGMAVTTAIVSQNTQGVDSIFTPPAHVLRDQLASVAADVDIDAVKIGMLGNPETIDIVREFIATLDGTPVVLDPVMVATSGDRLLDKDAESAILDLAGRVDCVTPNLKELAVLCGLSPEEEATDVEQAVAMARDWAKQTETTVIVKGGHLRDDRADNAVVDGTGLIHRVACPRVATKNTHGTGCSLSSALATRLGQGEGLAAALEWSTRWLHEAIANADALAVGRGHGPVDHGHRQRRLARAASAEPVPAVDVAAAYAAAQSQPAPQPAIPAAGPHTAALWAATLGLWKDLLDLPFIGRLGDGTLEAVDFSFYVAQDAIYLRHYSTALGRLGALARDPQDRRFWAAGAAEVLVAESELHRDWLGGETAARPSQVTSAYTDFLVATAYTEDYAVAAAAVLPCYWLYAEVGRHLLAQDRADHPFHAWLQMYSGPDFVEGTQRALQMVEDALEEATDAQRQRAFDAFYRASLAELAFFDQADRRF